MNAKHRHIRYKSEPYLTPNIAKVAPLPAPREITIAENTSLMQEMFDGAVRNALISHSDVLTNTLYNDVIKSMREDPSLGWRGPSYMLPRDMFSGAAIGSTSSGPNFSTNSSTMLASISTNTQSGKSPILGSQTTGQQSASTPFVGSQTTGQQSANAPFVANQTNNLSSGGVLIADASGTVMTTSAPLHSSGGQLQKNSSLGRGKYNPETGYDMPPVYQTPQNNYQSLQNNYQSHQSNYQTPQNNYRASQHNFQFPQNYHVSQGPIWFQHDDGVTWSLVDSVKGILQQIKEIPIEFLAVENGSLLYPIWRCFLD